MRHIKNYTQSKITKRKYDIQPQEHDIKIIESIENTELNNFYKKNEFSHVKYGRKEGLKKLKELKNISNYKTTRNTLALHTSDMSAYINMGCVSIRELLKQSKKIFGEDSTWETELFWRDFYYNVLYYNPKVVGNNFNEKYDKIVWKNNKIHFKKWCEGITGFPIVDAAMRQLNKTGYMHNRGRMIVSNFLTKDLGLDWRIGERYFAQHLIDYNISANNGGWQWSSGTGTDAQPYFRIFNPWTQIKKFDAQCDYVKKWIPELIEVPSKHIIAWNKYYDKYNNIDYPKPMLDHKDARIKTLEMYKKYL
jgi:deoxyribodipyrimidine photo-lyase